MSERFRNNLITTAELAGIIIIVFILWRYYGGGTSGTGGMEAGRGYMAETSAASIENGALVVVDEKIYDRERNGAVYLCAKIKNISDRTVSYPKAEFTTYDMNDTPTGKASDVTAELRPGAVWEAEARADVKEQFKYSLTSCQGKFK